MNMKARKQESHTGVFAANANCTLLIYGLCIYKTTMGSQLSFLELALLSKRAHPYYDVI